MLARLGRWCHDHRWRVVIAWIAAIVLLIVATAGAGQNFGASFETPDSEGGDGFDLIDEYFGGQGSGYLLSRNLAYAFLLPSSSKLGRSKVLLYHDGTLHRYTYVLEVLNVPHNSLPRYDYGH